MKQDVLNDFPTSLCLSAQRSSLLCSNVVAPIKGGLSFKSAFTVVKSIYITSNFSYSQSIHPFIHFISLDPPWATQILTVISSSSSSISRAINLFREHPKELRLPSRLMCIPLEQHQEPLRIIISILHMLLLHLICSIIQQQQHQ